MNIPRMPARLLIRRARAARVLDISINMLKRLEKSGRLTPVRIGSRDIFYAVREVEALAAGESADDQARARASCRPVPRREGAGATEGET